MLQVVAAGVLLVAVAGGAQELGYWHADSDTAKKVTGDIAIGQTRLTINFMPFPMTQIRVLKPEEMQALFDLEGTPASGGTLYRLSIPAGRTILHKTAICGNDDTNWMATALVGKKLEVAFLSGAAIPDLSLDAVLKGTNICGVYTFSK